MSDWWFLAGKVLLLNLWHDSTWILFLLWSCWEMSTGKGRTQGKAKKVFLQVRQKFLFYFLQGSKKSLQNSPMINKSGLNRPLNNCWIEAENCISNTKAVWFFVCFSYPTCPPWKSRAWFHVCSTYTLSSPVLKRVTRRRGITTHFPYPSLFPRYCRCGWETFL